MYQTHGVVEMKTMKDRLFSLDVLKKHESEMKSCLKIKLIIVNKSQN